MKPTILLPDAGYHNRNLSQAIDRLEEGQTYRDLSTIIVCPTRGSISARVVQSWLGLMKPMNQKVIGPLFAIGLEVGEAYNQMIGMILSNDELSKFQYLLTIEEDNCPPMDGLLRLYEGMNDYDVIGGLYWTKGEGGQPMIYGNPGVMPKNFIPQVPLPDSLQAANGLGMGFTLFKLGIFKRIPGPWFKTVQEVIPGTGARAYSQDLYFFEQAAKYGYRFASDNRVQVGHYDLANNMMW